ncbi:MAG: hypothetical protein AAFZ52_13825, partial [Bacteroidota bacterium]
MSFAFLPLFCPPAQRTATRPTPLVVKGAEDWHLHNLRSSQALRTEWPVAAGQADFWRAASTLSFLADRPQGMSTEGIVLENHQDLRRVLLTVQTFHFSAAGQVSDAAKGAVSRYDFRR